MPFSQTSLNLLRAAQFATERTQELTAHYATGSLPPTAKAIIASLTRFTDAVSGVRTSLKQQVPGDILQFWFFVERYQVRLNGPGETQPTWVQPFWIGELLDPPTASYGKWPLLSASAARQHRFLNACEECQESAEWLFGCYAPVRPHRGLEHELSVHAACVQCMTLTCLASGYVASPFEAVARFPGDPPVGSRSHEPEDPDDPTVWLE